MIDPASMADWAQASFLVTLLGGLAAACGWVLRQEQRERLLEARSTARAARSAEHTSELQSRDNLVCRLLPEYKTEMPRPGDPKRGPRLIGHFSAGPRPA